MNEKPVTKSSQASPKMQQIERYGVIALVFLLVTIVAVSFWGDSKSPGFWSRLTGKTEVKKETAEVLQPSTPPAPTEGAPIVTGNTPNVVDVPAGGAGTLGGTPNPFAPTTANPNPAQPIATPMVAPAASTGTTSYTIQSGDSLALIAKRQLGSESRWNEIQAANPGLDPKRLKLGATIQLPAGAAPVQQQKTTVAKAAAPKAKTAPAPKTEVASARSRTYTIKKGDLLRSIARTQLGDENRWKEIQSLNPSVDPSKLVVGATIKLPASAEKHSTSPSTSKPADGTVLVSLDKPRVK
jgi:nucleoid-associated protein YgaU